MRPYRQIHVNPRELTQIPVTRHDLSTSKCKILSIASLLIVFVITIVVPIVVSKRSNNKPPSLSTIRVSTTVKNSLHMTSFSNLTTLNIKSVSDSPSTIDLNISATIPNTAMTMISETKRFSTDAIDNTTPIQSTMTATVLPNLLINPGAESQLEGWTQNGSSPAIIDFDGNFHRNYYPRSGSYCFAGGKGLNSPSKLHQRIDLLGGVQGFTEEQLDSGKLKVFVSFYYQTYRDMLLGDDFSKVDVTIHSNSLDILDGIHTDELYCTPNPGWCHYNNSVLLPVGARVIYYLMLFYESENFGSAIDVYIDDNSLIIM